VPDNTGLMRHKGHFSKLTNLRQSEEVSKENYLMSEVELESILNYQLTKNQDDDEQDNSHLWVMQDIDEESDEDTSPYITESGVV